MLEFRIRVKDHPEAMLVVNHILTYHRADFPNGYIMSNSSGPKDMFKNQVWGLFEHDPEIEAVTVVRANGPFFVIVRKGERYYDLATREGKIIVGREIEVAQKLTPATTAAPPPPAGTQRTA